MIAPSILFILLVSSLAVIYTHCHSLSDVKHIRSGIAVPGCDTGKDNLTKDFDPSWEIEYKCLGERFKPNSPAKAVSICQPRLEEIMHVCMEYEIFYAEMPPLSGPHRHVWPEFGEYSYLPPQRWVHGIEHGATALLYHPCADPGEVDSLRQLLVGCKRRHIITPYRNLTRERPLALVSWGCKLEMGTPDLEMAKDFIKSFSLPTVDEYRTLFGWPWVAFTEGLIRKSHIVGHYSTDAIVCPGDPDVSREFPIEDEYHYKRKDHAKKQKSVATKLWEILGLAE